MSYEPIASINLQGTLNTSAPPLSPASQNSLSDGSWNAIVSGDGLTRGCSGFDSMGANAGSRKMLPFGKTWGGIRDIGGVQGSGNFFEDIGRSRWGIGSGQPTIEGADVSGFVLSTLLQVSVASGGAFSAPVQAGLSQPSAPEIGIVALPGDVKNPITSKIERRRPSTGARSLASPTSAVINPQSNRVRLTFPLALGSQTHWRAYFTFQGFGGTGIHYLALYNGSADIPESIVAAGTVDGINRSLEFNFKDGDLLPIEASYDDYAPPAATHAIRLQNVLTLWGCYSDTATPTSTNPGTAGAVSKINNYESYIPTSLLFLPEQVTDVLARPIDDYGYIACENGIYAEQYVGYRGEELPPCTITPVLPDIGIKYPHNWATSRGRLIIYAAEGNLILMDEKGEFDTAFAGPIIRTIKDWNPASTIVGFDPKNDLAICANGSHILVYSFAAQIWRQIWLPDYGVSGSVLSCATAKRRLYISVVSGANAAVYSFDTANQAAPLSFVCNYQTAQTGAGAVRDIYELAVSAETGAATASLAVCISKNLRKSVFRRVSIASGSNVVGDAESGFTSDLNGRKAIIFAGGAGGAGTEWIKGKVSAASGSTFALVDNAGAAINAAATAGELLMFVGDYVASKPFGSQARHFANFFPNVIEARSFQVSFWLKGRNSVGNVLTADLSGTTYASSRAL